MVSPQLNNRLGFINPGLTLMANVTDEHMYLLDSFNILHFFPARRLGFSLAAQHAAQESNSGCETAIRMEGTDPV